MNFVRFFVGTPRRFLATLVTLAVIFAAIRPDIIRTGVHNVIYELGPVFGQVVQIGITLAVIVVLLRAVLPGGGKKK